MAKQARFGITLPQIKRTWQEARDAAVEIDALGYDSLWVCDHVYGVPAPNLPNFEAWSELAAVAAVTKQARLGTLVTPPFFRNPAILAKQIATIDHVAAAGASLPASARAGSSPSSRARARRFRSCAGGCGRSRRTCRS